MIIFCMVVRYRTILCGIPFSEMLYRSRVLAVAEQFSLGGMVSAVSPCYGLYCSSFVCTRSLIT